VTNQDIQQLIFEALKMLNCARNEEDKIPISPETPLFGNNGYLDSMELVSLLIDLEESFLSKGVRLALSDERAMSEIYSPYRDIPSLSHFIFKLIEDK